MHQITKSFQLIALVVLIASFATAAHSAPTAGTNAASTRPEVQMSPQEMEKFLEGLARYLQRQRWESSSSSLLSSSEDSSAETTADANANDQVAPYSSASSSAERSSEQPASSSNSLIHPRPSMSKWPWSLANNERDGAAAASAILKQRPMYTKRNSELINSLLGLPRFMKVVG